MRKQFLYISFIIFEIAISGSSACGLLSKIFKAQVAFGFNIDTFVCFSSCILCGSFVLVFKKEMLQLVKTPSTDKRNQQPNNKLSKIQYLLGCLLPEEISGDLQEERQERLDMEGLHAANRWYRQQVLASLCWQLCRTVARMVSKIASR